jgi:putative hydrolase of the HAD superfamily
MKKRRIKGIVFDIGGVLALDTTVFSVHKEMARKFKLNMDDWFDSIDSAYVNSMEGKISEKEALEKIAKNLKSTPKKVERFFISLYHKNFKQNKKLYSLAFNLKKIGYKIGILSDQWAVSKKALIPPKYAKKFDSVIVSCDVGFRKPHPRIYQMSIKELKLKSEEIVFVDNREWNLEPAKKLGMKTILYENNNQLFSSLKKILKKNVNKH